MEKKRFSSDELFLLRNEIPLVLLIQKGLDISSHDRHGRFCFQCPLCKEFNTAVNPKTNLAKCFRCQKMFNTIDLVMQVRQSDFVDSVRFLRNFYTSISIRTKPRNPISPIDHSGHDRSAKCAPQKATPSLGPQHIAQILDGLIMPRKTPSTANQPALTPHSSMTENPEDHQTNNTRILQLEKKVEHLSLQIERIIKLMDQNPSST
jgi:hypothetical protein